MTSQCYTPLTVFQSLIRSESLEAVCIAALRSPAVPSRSSFFGYLTFFLFTCLLEAPFYFVVGRFAGKKNYELLIQILALNLATHPIVFWAFPYMAYVLHLQTVSMIVVGETFAPAVEALLLRKWNGYLWSTSILTALAANLFSWWTGLWIGS